VRQSIRGGGDVPGHETLIDESQPVAVERAEAKVGNFPIAAWAQGRAQPMTRIFAAMQISIQVAGTPGRPASRPSRPRRD
jgi:hypothetical protein